MDFYFQINIFQLGFILSVLLTLAAGIFIPFFLIVFPRFLVRQGNKWSKFIIFMLISGRIETKSWFSERKIEFKKSCPSNFKSNVFIHPLKATCFMQVLFGATMIQGKNYSSEFVTSALKDQMTVSFNVQLIFFTSHQLPLQIFNL